MPSSLTRRDFIALGSAFVVVAALPPAAFAADDPVAFAKSLYALKNLWSDATADDEAMAKYLDPKLAALVATNYSIDDFESAIDYDPLVQAQDYDQIKPVFKVESQSAKDATVRSTFKNFGETTTIVLDLVMTPKGWRLGDIHNSDGGSLVQEITELNGKRQPKKK
ncbi:hypothetical protein BH10PSE9_BH10PSE9_20110 [soil metagenome]